MERFLLRSCRLKTYSKCGLLIDDRESGVGPVESSSEVEGGWERANAVPAELTHLAREKRSTMLHFLGSIVGLSNSKYRSRTLIQLHSIQ
jgi:hypothetical protein